MNFTHLASAYFPGREAREDENQHVLRLFQMPGHVLDAFPDMI